MLFEKIRRTQKPVFIFLGLVFALSFVFLGVGSGAGGISLGNLLGQSSGSSTTSVSDLLSKVHSDPKDATAWRLRPVHEPAPQGREHHHPGGHAV
jgi:hypothetical protein